MEEQLIHQRLTTYKEIADAVRHINESINGRGFNFMEDTAGRNKNVAFAHVSDSDYAIIVLASFDFSYYHDLELIFYDVSYTTLEPECSWRDHWTKDQLELINDTPGDKEIYFEFRFNKGTHSDIQYIVRAKGFSYYLGHVSYWK